MQKDVFKKIKFILIWILFANIGVAILKIVIGTIIKSASMTADGFHSLTDGSSNVVGLVGIQIASKPVDKGHPYGHRKFEVLAGLFIAAMLFFLSGKILTDAIPRFSNPIMPEVSVASILVLLVTLIINILVSTTEYRSGKKLGSSVLMSDAMHTRSDIYVTIGVLTTLVGLKLGLPAIIDPIASIVVAGFILKAGIEIFKDTTDILVDKAVADPESFIRIAKEFPEVCDVHKVRSRGSVQDLYVDMHVMVDPQMSVEASHELMHNIEERMMEVYTGLASVIVHIEPFYTNCAKTAKD